MVSVRDEVIFLDYAHTVGIVGIDKAKPKEHARITKRALIAMEGPRGGLQRVDGFYPIAVPRIDCMRQHSLFSAENPVGIRIHRLLYGGNILQGWSIAPSV